MFRALFIGLVVVLIWAGAALASPFDNMSVEEIRKHSDFVADDYSLSQAENSVGQHIYQWIGYIPTGDKRVYFTANGEALTCVKWDETGEWVPEWVVDALNTLLEDGIIKMAQ